MVHSPEVLHSNGYGPLAGTVTTRIITCLVGNPYKPSFATVTVRGPHPSNLMEQPTNTARLNDELDLPEKYIAVQIRRGDKVAGNRKDWGERFC